MQALRAERLAHALLFVGASGVGKRPVAEALAQALICTQPQFPCGECGACLRVEKGQSESLMVVEPEGAFIKIEQSQQVLKFVSLRSLGRSRVVIVDQAHLLNPHAANALLKVIEEPPEGTYFILVASSLSGVLPTLRSRSQVVRFASLSKAELKQLIPGGEDWVMEAAQGRLELALQLLNEEKPFLREKSLVFWSQRLVEKQSRETVVNFMGQNRVEDLFIVRLWQQILRDARVYQVKPQSVIHQDQQNLLKDFESLNVDQLDDMAVASLELEKDLSANIDRQLAFETFDLKVQDLINDEGLVR